MKMGSFQREYFMKKASKIDKQISERIRILKKIQQDANFSSFCQQVAEDIQYGLIPLVVGNGGSSTQASHLVSELVGKYNKIRHPITAFNLSDPSNITCIGNDFGFDYIFSRQINSIVHDNFYMIIAFTTSGNSKNIINALKMAKRKDIFTVLFSGKSGGDAVQYADRHYIVPSDDTGIIQEVHTLMIHAICEQLEK